MTDQKRRLAAILSADVVGYSRLMGDDEEATIEVLVDCRDVFSKRVENHDGRVVDTAGDSVLSVFDSVVEAVRCAVEIQIALAERNEELSEDRKMRFRIGINLGDIIEKEDGTVYGDGVNIAARMEALADPGGVTLSDDAYRQVRTKLEVTFEDMGDQEVKNIAERIRAFRLVDSESTRPGPVSQAQLELPDKPSIAVLPFQNLSGDPEQEYFSDGLTEDIITDLSKLSGLFVIGRNSSFAYKGKTVDLARVGRELGVHYALEGSVQKAGDRVRINAKLADVTSSRYVWAERYEGTSDDIFALQDDITGKIVSALSVQLTAAEEKQRGSEYTTSAEAHDLFLRARVLYRQPSPVTNAEALAMFDAALALDPGFALALAYRSYVKFHAWFFGWNTDPDAMDLAIRDAETSVVQDPNLAIGHSFLGWMHMWKDGHQRSLSEHEQALALDPNSSDAQLFYSSSLIFSGHPELAEAPMIHAHRLDPHLSAPALLNYVHLYLQAGRYAEAERYRDELLEKAPDYPAAHVYDTMLRNACGELEGVRKSGEEIVRLMPNATVTALSRQYPYKKPEHQARLVEGLRAAGLPES